MVVKLVLGLLLIAIIISVAVISMFWYLKNRAELNHEKEMQQMEQTSEIFDSEFGGDDEDRI